MIVNSTVSLFLYYNLINNMQVIFSKAFLKLYQPIVADSQFTKFYTNFKQNIRPNAH